MEEEEKVESIKVGSLSGAYDPGVNESLRFDNFFPGSASGSMIVSDDESLAMDVENMPCWRCQNSQVILRKLHGQGSVDGTVAGGSLKYDEVRCLAVVPSLVIIDGIPDTLETTSSLSPIISCNRFKAPEGEVSVAQIVNELKAKPKKALPKKAKKVSKGRSKK